MEVLLGNLTVLGRLLLGLLRGIAVTGSLGRPVVGRSKGLKIQDLWLKLIKGCSYDTAPFPLCGVDFNHTGNCLI